MYGDHKCEVSERDFEAVRYDLERKVGQLEQEMASLKRQLSEALDKLWSTIRVMDTKQ